mmetsp:Transcript_67017/g.143346  ORF Transcript_67017/g.143346 Transcript_67017/m.143346 type:complete len:386 (+) Transcript_67017:59-1216(+)
MSWAGEAPALVLDNGSGTCKAGFAGEREPRVAIPAVAGWPKSAGSCERLRLVGNEALARGNTLNLKHPIEHGVVMCWEDMENVWRHTFEQLQAEPGERPVLMTEAPLNPKANRESMVQVMFEEFDVPALHVAVSGALSLYATGSRTGLVVESGDGVTQVVPIFDDFVVPHAVKRLDLGGRDLSDYLTRLLREERGYPFATTAERRAAWDMKEKHCYVAQNFNAELARAAETGDQERSYALPDGSAIIAAGAERFRCPEALFQPGSVGKDVGGVHEMAFQAITQCDVDVQRALAANIVISGGSMLFEGMRERILKELTALLPPTMPAKVALPLEPRNAAFTGGSILASMGDFKSNWVSRRDYEEYGTALINTRSLSLTEAGARHGK